MKHFYLTTFLLISFFSLKAQNNALNFDGNDDYVEFPSDAIFDITSEISMEAFVYPTQYANENSIITKYGDVTYQDSYLLRLQNGIPTFHLKIVGYGWAQVDATDVVSLNTWTHIAAVYDGATMKIFVNGVLSATKPQTGSITVSSSKLKIGKWSASDAFHGHIDEVRLWNIARTDSEISQHYTTASASTETGLIGYYTFDQGTANGDNTGVMTLTDASSSGIDGTLYNFELTATSSNWVGGVEVATLSLDDPLTPNTPSISLYPNPASDYVQVSGMTANERFSIYNILGSKMFQGTASNNDKIEVSNFPKGVYIIKFENGNTIKFTKR
ncbi:LamG-like jellyroll fold domain-containing protein [Winogradskyella arenosi]|uniref:Putative secreted protein (Por secretion system target) n=1 Tax=Winogradskyella arenosi TaxID=533325 RepID=A0A368ZHY3_9FLAO|nr:LamG-like jellyroll fold domain-containing protein [Winogradskyella arenosi]RCW92820.1 putative secreted protein (Por secretion system target) [Winogradskyella arenosi]